MSTDEYTPTTEAVREAWLGVAHRSPGAGAAFDRWLAEHDRQVAEQAGAQALRDAAKRVRNGAGQQNKWTIANFLDARAVSAAPALGPFDGAPDGLGSKTWTTTEPAAPARPTTDDREALARAVREHKTEWRGDWPLGHFCPGCSRDVEYDHQVQMALAALASRPTTPTPTASDRRCRWCKRCQECGNYEPHVHGVAATTDGGEE